MGNKCPSGSSPWPLWVGRETWGLGPGCLHLPCCLPLSILGVGHGIPGKKGRPGSAWEVEDRPKRLGFGVVS